MSKNIKVCICGKTNKQHDMLELRVGVVALAICATASLIINMYVGLLFIAIPLTGYIGIVIYNILRSHSVKCSLRKSLFDAVYILSILP